MRGLSKPPLVWRVLKWSAWLWLYLSLGFLIVLLPVALLDQEHVSSRVTRLTVAIYVERGIFTSGLSFLVFVGLAIANLFSWNFVNRKFQALNLIIRYALNSFPIAVVAVLYATLVLVGLFGDQKTENLAPTIGLLLLQCAIIGFGGTAALHLSQIIFARETAAPLTDMNDEAYFSAHFYKHLSESVSKDRALQILNFRRRSERILRWSGCVLLFIVVFLIGVTVFSVYSGRIAGFDTSSVNALDLIEGRIKETLEEVRRVRRSSALIDETDKTIDALRQIEPRIRDALGGARADLEREQRRLRDSLSDLQRLLSREGIATGQRRAIQAELALREKELASRIEVRSEIEKRLQPDLSGDRQREILVAAAITRFGILAVAVYLVQILMRLYRYNVRLAAYYRSLADALMLWGSSPVAGFSKFASSMCPTVDYGGVPDPLVKSILDKYAEALKGASNLAKRVKKNDPHEQQAQRTI